MGSFFDPLPPGHYSLEMGSMTKAHMLAFMGLRTPCPFDDMNGAGVSQDSPGLARAFDRMAQAYVDTLLVVNHLVVCKDCEYALIHLERIHSRLASFKERHRRIQDQLQHLTMN